MTRKIAKRKTQAIASVRAAKKAKARSDAHGAMAEYHKLQGATQEAHDHAVNRLICRRSLGKWFAGIAKQRGKRTDKQPDRSAATRFKQAMEELEVGKDTVARWQREATVPDERFERYCAEQLEKDRLPTDDGLRSLTRNGRARADKARKQPDLAKTHKGVLKGDFRKVLSQVQEIDAIITDPPYGKASLDLWTDLGKFAADKLTENGVLVAYSGQMYLPEVFDRLRESLDYWWTFAVVHQGSGNLTPLGQPVRKVINKWKPVLMFVRNGEGFDETFSDVIPSVEPDKHDHNWAQPIQESVWIIEQFTIEGALVVDPMAGGGTVGHACDMTKRRFIGAEILK